LLPIPIQIPHIKLERQWLETEISVAWIGRLDDEKWPALLASIELVALISAKAGVMIRYHIIGEGAYLQETKKLCRPGIEFIIAGRLSGQELGRYLLHGCRLGFAMGTSALEFGALAIPVLVVDPAKRVLPLSNVRLRWLHQIAQYDLGSFAGEEKLTAPDAAHVKELLLSRKLNAELGTKCQEYVRQNHNVSVIAERLNEYASRSELTMADLNKLLHPSPFPLGPYIYHVRNRVFRKRA
jgi:hypothetical protein